MTTHRHAVNSGIVLMVIMWGALLMPFSAQAGIELLAEENDLLLIGDSDFSNLPSSLATGDFNGDGIDDLAVGVPKERHPAAAGTGIVSLFLGGAEFPDLPDPTMVRRDEDVLLYGSAINENAGYLVAAGDLNSDGVDDLAVVAQKSGAYGTSKIYVVFGNDKITDITDGFLSVVADVTIEREYANFTALEMGDMNHDGIDDLLVADNLTGLLSPGPYHVSRQNGPQGAVYAIFGHTGQWVEAVDLASGVDLTIVRGSGTKLFQVYSLAIGDINDDGYGDLATGVPRDAGGLPLSPALAGQVHIVFGQSWTGLTTVDIDAYEDVVIYGALPEDRIGGWLTSTTVPAHPLAFGDVNSDSVEDLIVGAPDSGLGDTSGDSIGKVEVVYGGTGISDKNLLTDSDVRILFKDGSKSKYYTGYAVDVADINYDGKGDILVGSARAYLGGGAHSSDGALFAVYGTSALPQTLYLVPDADVLVSAPSRPELLGAGQMSSNFAVGDWNATGVPDMLVGAPEGYTADRGWAAFFFDPLCCCTLYVASNGTCGGKAPCYATVQESVDSASEGAQVLVTAETYAGNLNITAEEALELVGGFNSSFTQNTGFTTIDGTLTISGGTVSVDRIIVM